METINLTKKDLKLVILSLDEQTTRCAVKLCDSNLSLSERETYTDRHNQAKELSNELFKQLLSLS
jgi:hypothetical protein